MERHLGYPKHSLAGHNSGNSRKGTTGKTLKGAHDEVRIETPRDRNSSFEPRLVKKGQTRIIGKDEQILCLYAKGLSIQGDSRRLSGNVRGGSLCRLVLQVTNAVIEQVREWQARVLDKVYPIVFFDCPVVKIRQDKRVIRKAIYPALGINLEGQKELLGMWISETEGARFWLSIFTELKNRGIGQIMIAPLEGLKGFPEAIQAE